MYFFDDTWSILDEHMASYQLEYSNKIRVTEWIMIRLEQGLIKMKKQSMI